MKTIDLLRETEAAAGAPETEPTSTDARLPRSFAASSIPNSMVRFDQVAIEVPTQA